MALPNGEGDREYQKFATDKDGNPCIRTIVSDSGVPIPTQPSYMMSDVDETTDLKYYGFLDSEGNWYIQRDDWSVMNIRSTRYVKGSSDYATNWGNRASLSYDYYDEVF